LSLVGPQDQHDGKHTSGADGGSHSLARLTDRLPFGRADRRGRPAASERRWRSRVLGARASDHALYLAADVASTSGAQDAEGCHREALRLAGDLGMRP